MVLQIPKRYYFPAHTPIAESYPLGLTKQMLRQATVPLQTTKRGLCGSNIFKNYMRIFYFLFLLIFNHSVFSQADTNRFIKIHFLYGSKPAKGFKKKELKFVGGLHGGHVSIETEDSVDIGFSPKGATHIFSHRRNKGGYFDKKINKKGHPVYPLGYKLTTIIIPVTKEQLKKLNEIQNAYLAKPPYDYAFFGMRCASATQDILSQTGIVKHRRISKNVRTTFYPKKLRRRLIKLAEEKGYKIERQEGRITRKWEKD